MRLSALIACAALLAPSMLAQERTSEPIHSFKVDFTMHEGPDGKIGRHFSLLTDTSGRAALRTGTRVPVLNSKDETTYIDLGVNINCYVREQSGRVMLNADFEVNALARSEAPVLPRPPIVQTRFGVTTALQPGKSVVIASIDDPTLQRRIDVEALVTKVD